MGIKHLFIIGNGFDNAHKMPTQYINFRDYLFSKYPEAESFDELLPERIFLPDGGEDFYPEDIAGFITWIIDRCGDGTWGELEAYLGNSIFDCFSDVFDETDLGDSEKDLKASFYNNEERSRIIQDVFVRIKKLFYEWIMEYYSTFQYGHSPLFRGKHSLMLNSDVASVINESDGILTFNYTFTLEKVYEIDERIICHIHGKVGDPYESVYFGHGDDEPFQEDPYRWGIEESLDILKSELRKNTFEAYQRHIVFFDNIGDDLMDIHSFGFSFSDVDLFYIERLAERIDLSKVVWYINTFDDNKRKENTKAGKKLAEQIKKIEEMGFRIEVDNRW